MEEVRIVSMQEMKARLLVKEEMKREINMRSG